MSYILEALRRAERERNPTQSPEVRIISDADGARIAVQRPPWPWIVTGLVLAFGLGALLVTALLRDDTAATSLAAPDIAAAPASAAPPAPTAARAGMIEDLQADPSSPQRLDDLVDPEAGLSELPPEPELLAPDPLPEPAQASAAFVEPAAPEPAYRSEIDAIELDPAPEPEIPVLKDMPADYRADFPRLSVDVHFYENAVARRFVMLNGRRYREGDALREGPQLVEITSDGLILDHRGRQVFLPAQP